jgi:hypothetical protein
MNRLLAQRDLEVMMTNLLPLLPVVSRKSCEAGTNMLAGLLGEALEAQEAASKRTDDLKQMNHKGLMELFTPEKGKGPAVNGSLVKKKAQKELQQKQDEEPGEEEEGAGEPEQEASGEKEESEKAAFSDT